MSAVFDPASWVQRAEACGLAPRAVGRGLQYNADGREPEAGNLLADLNAGDEEQWRPKHRAVIEQLRGMHGMHD